MHTKTRQSHRAGISLIEVLISMFVLLFGLMGVAVIFPVGNHFAARGETADRATVVADAAFAELQTRGLLKPDLWYSANGGSMNRLIRSSDGNFDTSIWGRAFVIDPIGSRLGWENSMAQVDVFPRYSMIDQRAGQLPISPNKAGWRIADTRWPLRRLTFMTTNPMNGSYEAMPVSAAETVFKLRDDLSIALPKDRDKPGVQSYLASPQYPNVPLQRISTGSFSWIATVAPPSNAALEGMQPSDPRHGDFLYEVSVAVMKQRTEIAPDISGERMLSADMYPGGELQVYTNVSGSDGEATIKDAFKDVRE
ncbi:MAG: hypothetical protein KDA61_08815, partial [Planctomycetales bacterium]|nr:hypothetical protein [Planctomycetales bacterium]